MASSRPGTGATAVAGVRVRTVCVEALGDHARSWDELVEQSPLPTPFLRSWWLAAVAADRPSFVLVLDGDRLLGGLALEQHHHHGIVRYRHIGDRLGDHLDVVARDGHESTVVAALHGWWRRPGARAIEVRWGATRDGHLADVLSGRGHIEPGLGAPYATLPASFHDYLRRRPGQLRNTIERATARLERDGVVHRIVDRPADVDRALGALRALHGSRWGAASQFLPELDRFAAAARAGVAAGECVFHELVHDGTVIATEVDFELAGRTSFYQAGRIEDRRWRGSGTVLKAKVVERACAAGQREYDLLRGLEPYKEQWGDGVRELATIRAVRGPAAHAVVGLERAGRRSRALRRRLVDARTARAGDA